MCIYDCAFIVDIYNEHFVIKGYYRVRQAAQSPWNTAAFAFHVIVPSSMCHGIDDVTTAGYTVPVRCFHVTATSPRGRGLIPKPLPLGGPCPAAGQLAAIRSAPLETWPTLEVFVVAKHSVDIGRHCVARKAGLADKGRVYEAVVPPATYTEGIPD